MPDYAGEKTLEPTPHRRQQARREGHVAKSHDLGSAAMLLAGTGRADDARRRAGRISWSDYCRSQLGGQPWLTVDTEFVVSHWNATLWALGRYLLPILGLLCLAGVAVNVLQIGFLFLPQRLAFDLTPAQSAARPAAHLLGGQRGPTGLRHRQTRRRLGRGRRGAVQPARRPPGADRPGAPRRSPGKWRKSCSGRR